MESYERKREAARREASQQMESFAEAAWLALSLEEKLKTWQRYMDLERNLFGLPPGSLVCPPDHVPAGLAIRPIHW